MMCSPRLMVPYSADVVIWLRYTQYPSVPLGIYLVAIRSRGDAKEESGLRSSTVLLLVLRNSTVTATAPHQAANDSGGSRFESCTPHLTSYPKTTQPRASLDLRVFIAHWEWRVPEDQRHGEEVQTPGLLVSRGDKSSFACRILPATVDVNDAAPSRKVLTVATVYYGEDAFR